MARLKNEECNLPHSLDLRKDEENEGISWHQLAEGPKTAKSMVWPKLEEKRVYTRWLGVIATSYQHKMFNRLNKVNQRLHNILPSPLLLFMHVQIILPSTSLADLVASYSDCSSSVRYIATKILCFREWLPTQVTTPPKAHRTPPPSAVEVRLIALERAMAAGIAPLHPLRLLLQLQLA